MEGMTASPTDLNDDDDDNVAMHLLRVV